MIALRVAKEAFVCCLLQTLKVRFDLSTLALQLNTFLELNLRQYVSDILFSVELERKNSYVYCLVTKSRRCINVLQKGMTTP